MALSNATSITQRSIVFIMFVRDVSRRKGFP